MAALLPDLPLASIVAAALIIVLAYVVFGLTGFGAAVVGVPLLAHFFPIRFCVPMMLVFDLCAGLLLGLRNRRQVDRAELLRLAPFAAIGMVLGVTALVKVPERGLLGLLGAFVIAYAAWSLLTRLPARPVNPRWAAPAGIAGGAFTALYGTGGPIYTIYLARRIADPARVRASIAVLVFCLAWARLALFASTGLLFQPSLLRLAVLLVPCAIAGYFIGSHLHRRLQPAHASRAIWALLIASGVSLVGALQARLMAAAARSRAATTGARPAQRDRRATAHGHDAFQCLCLQALIGIDDDRPADHAQQRQVVDRVAVERRVVQAVSGSASVGEPGLQTRHLAVAHVEDAGVAAGETAVRHVELGRDQVGDGKQVGDRLGQEAIGGGGEDDSIAGVTMRRDERERGGAEARRDPRRDEACALLRPLGSAAAGERCRVEGAELGRRDRAGGVAGGDVAVGRREGGAVEDAFVDQELAPQLVGVAVEQRAVEVEEREPRGGAQAERRCQAFGRVNAWMP